MPKPRNQQTENRPGLGTFAAVFTPSILTILGIILFLRLGYVVGQVGIGKALVIILMANAISVLTSISLSAIATNLRVKGGGDYYLISRTLGVEYGGAVGLVLFLAQSVSIAFYALGFGEVVAVFVSDAPSWLPQAIAGGAVAALFVLAWLGADWATRFQYVVMAVLFAAILGFFIGGVPDWGADRFSDNFGPAGGLPFWVVFALFFPAVTGFTQGVSMSGDLKNPGKSLPRGTFAAVFLSVFVYIALALLFAGTLPGETLVNDYSATRRIAVLPWLVDAGVIAATLSSALASFLGAPRILQSLSADRVFPLLNPFAAGSGPSNNPRRGVLLSAGIAFATVALGELNLIAPVVSMFFLISYGLLNYATYVEARANSPYFRPSFRWFHKRWSLLGGVCCLGAMLAIHPLAGSLAVVVLFALYQYVARTVSVERWADSDRSHRFQRVREDLHAISHELEHPRDWRPVVLAFSDDPARRERLLRFADWLEGRSGFTTAVRLIKREGTQPRRQQQASELELRNDINRHHLPAFAKVIVAEDLEQALPVVLQAHGLGRLRANTALVNWHFSGDQAVTGSRLRMLRVMLQFGMNLVMVSASEEEFERLEASNPKSRHIDVWYRDNVSGQMMLMLAYLMTRSDTWKDAVVRVFVARGEGTTTEQSRERLEQRLEEYRIAAEAVIVERADAETILAHWTDSSLVLLPIRIADGEPQLIVNANIQEMIQVLGITVFVLATADLELDAEPESGKHGEIAAAVDVAKHAQESLKQIEKELARVEHTVQQTRTELAKADAESTIDPAELKRLNKAHEQAKEQLEDLKRRAARANAKATQSAEEAERLTGPHNDGD